MKKLISVLLICMMFVLTACGNTADEVKDNSEQTENVSEETTKTKHWSEYENSMRVLAFNVFYQNVEERKDNVIDLILKQDPDVMLLQEVSVEWIPHLQAFMSEHDYSYYGYGRYGSEMSDTVVKNGDQFVPILWKTDKYDLVDSGHFWLSDTPEVQSAAWFDGTTSEFPRCNNWVILKEKATGIEFVATSVHTAPGEDGRVRTKSCELISYMINEIRGDRMAILGGDWNMQLTDDAYYAITEGGGFFDLRGVAEEADKGGSFNAWGKRAEGEFAFGDHIFVSENVAAKNFVVVDDRYNGEHISDHNPLFTELYY